MALQLARYCAVTGEGKGGAAEMQIPPLPPTPVPPHVLELGQDDVELRAQLLDFSREGHDRLVDRRLLAVLGDGRVLVRADLRSESMWVQSHDDAPTDISAHLYPRDVEGSDDVLYLQLIAAGRCGGAESNAPHPPRLALFKSDPGVAESARMR